MKEKFKKFFISFNRLNKSAVLIAVLFCLFLGLVFPSQLVQAQGLAVVGGILGALMALPILFFSVLLQILLFISNLIVSLAGALLWWVLSPYFMSMPYTYGGIIDIGWPIVRDFVNMLFIVALVIIGLSTALRIKEYQAQKALPLLIIIAILINFTPVICGFILDAVNIFMNFFLEEITGYKLFVSLLSTQATMVIDGLIRIPDIRYAASLLGKTIGLIAFDWIAAFVFFMYAVLFVMRYIMIWVLVIVSPIAFFSRIFPGSQKYFFKSILGWDEWWKQFIEWSMIGVIGAFFLYLGEQLLILAPSMMAPLPPDVWGGWLLAPLIEFINNLLPYGVVLAFLIIGFFTATETSAMGATAVTSWFKEQGMAIGKTAMFPLQRLGAQGIALGAGILGKTGGWVGRGITGVGERIPVLGKPLERAGRGFEAMAVAPLRRYAARARRLNFDEMFRDMEAGEIVEQILTLLSKKDRVTATAWMAEKGLADKSAVGEDFKQKMIAEAQALAGDPAYQKSASDVLETYTRGVNEKVMLDLEIDPEKQEKLKGEIGKIADEISKDVTIKPQIEAEAEKNKTTFERAARDMAAREIWVSGLKPGDVGDIEKKSLREDAGARRGMKSWSSAHMSALVNNFKKDVVEDSLNNPGGLNAMFKDKTEEESREILEKLYEENPRIVSFFTTTPAGRAWDWKGREFMPEGGLGELRKSVETRKEIEERRRKKISPTPKVTPEEEKEEEIKKPPEDKGWGEPKKMGKLKGAIKTLREAMEEDRREQFEKARRRKEEKRKKKEEKRTGRF